jgi:hypothetical protein
MLMNKFIFFEGKSGHGYGYASVWLGYARPAVTEERTSLDEPTITETVIVTPAETAEAYLARIVAAIVPVGARSIVIDEDALPGLCTPDRVVIDWDTQTVRPGQPLPPTQHDIDQACDQRVIAALGPKRPSMQAEGLMLAGRVAIGLAQGGRIEQILTQDQRDAQAMFDAINTCETAMVNVREALIQAPPATLDDVTWPTPPEGLATFLRGY